jgi:hypothetical protein
MASSSSSNSAGDNIFQSVLTDAVGVENDLLGPAYPYYKNINSPTSSSMNMSSNGTLSALGQDIEGLIAYVQLLVEGGGNASEPGGPIGNKYFLKTGAKCMDTETNEEVDRYIYVDNVPTGNIPFVSSAMGQDFTEFEGLIPGAMSDLNVFNPYAILQSFLSGSTPKCQSLTMETINNSNVSGTETQYVTLTDIQNMDPCIFPNKSNPVSGKGCSTEGFSNNRKLLNKKKIGLPKDRIVQMYFASLAILGIFIIYKLMDKSN